MHEFSICEEMVRVLLVELEKQPPGARLRRARVVTGRLRQIVPESLSFAFEVLTRNTPAAGAQLDIVTAPIVVKCRSCAWQGELSEMVFQCGACGAREVQMVGGDELYLESLEIERADSNEDRGNQGPSGSAGRE
jgi:hydrogenase nickel incorporation protein HypA/HybF